VGVVAAETQHSVTFMGVEFERLVVVFHAAPLRPAPLPARARHAAAVSGESKD